MPGLLCGQHQRVSLDKPKPRWYLLQVASKEQVCLVDGTNMFFRAFHALPPLTNRSGLPTGAVYGFTSMLAKLLRDGPDTRIIVVVDARGKTFRSEIDPQYKANRSPTPADLVTQIPWIKKMVPALGLPLVEVSGVEADDVIGTLATQAREQGCAVDIVTSDKDMMQLVGGGVQLVDTMQNRVSREPEVEKKFGVPPAQVIDVQGLMGDAVDNIPGVKGIGEKTARRLIEHFGSLEKLYDDLDGIAELGLRGAAGIRKKLEAGKEDAWRSRLLATIRQDVEVVLGDFQREEPDLEALAKLSAELEFDKILADILGPEREPVAAVAVDLVSPDTLLGLLAGPEDGALCLLSDDDGEACAWSSLEKTVVCDSIPATLGAVINATGAGACYVDGWGNLCHRLGLAAAGTTVIKREIHDLRIASYVLEPSRRGHTLEALLRDRQGLSLPDPESTIRSDRVGLMARKALELGRVLIAEVESAGLDDLYRDMEMPLVPILAAMEARGIGVSIAALEAAGAEFSEKVKLLEGEIYAIAGEEFNIGSTKQLRQILFEKLALPTKGVKKGKTGLSVDADVLARLAQESPIAEKIVLHRTLSKLNSTYVTGLLSLVDRTSGRVHTHFNQTVAATGRLSSSDPNLQNIPVRTEEGRRIRQSFVARDGWIFLAADYSQIELRVLAHLTADPVLVEAFRAGEDIHRRTAAEVYEVDPVFVSADMRRQAKVINFGILYGMGPQRLSRELGIPRAEATGIIERYFQRYSEVQAFADRVLEEGRERGYVETMLGRRRHLPELASKQPGLRQAAERMAWNSPIQGTAADIIKLSMLTVEKRLASEDLRADMLLQVHDELFFEVLEADAERLGTVVREEMEQVVPLAVPLVTDLKMGRNWSEMS